MSKFPSKDSLLQINKHVENNKNIIRFNNISSDNTYQSYNLPAFKKHIPTQYPMIFNSKNNNMSQSNRLNKDVSSDVFFLKRKSSENPNVKNINYGITLYVGRLTKEFKNDSFKKILICCGQLKSWKRANQNFGFVSYLEPEGALRALDILNGLQIKNKKILVTVDKNMQNVLNKYKKGLIDEKFPLQKSKKVKEEYGTIKEKLKNRNVKALKEIHLLLKEYNLESIDDRKDKYVLKEKEYEHILKKKNENQQEKQKDHFKKINNENNFFLPKTQKDLISMIPSEEKDILKYNIDWIIIKKSEIIERKMKNWINSRLTDFLGGQDDTDLTNFVVGMLLKHKKPYVIIKEMLMFLVDDARNFVIKMWRRLIFEMLKTKFDIA